VEEDAGAGAERRACVHRAATGRHASACTAPLFRRDEEGRRGAYVTHRNSCRRIRRGQSSGRSSLSTSPRRAAPIAASGPWRERWAHRASGSGSVEVAGGFPRPPPAPNREERATLGPPPSVVAPRRSPPPRATPRPSKTRPSPSTTRPRHEVAQPDVARRTSCSCWAALWAEITAQH
jgi:hypothetical protein